MDNLWYLVAAFSLAWIVLLGYVLVLARRQTRVEESTHYLEGLLQSALQLLEELVGAYLPPLVHRSAPSAPIRRSSMRLWSSLSRSPP